MIAAAVVRSQISQIEQYNTAANTFKLKYGMLPGDISEPNASGFGLIARGTIAGSGDGNDLIEGNNGAAGTNGPRQLYGETALFWSDLSKAGMIEGSYTAALAVEVAHSAVTASTSPALRDYFPEAKVGGNNYIYVWSGGLAIGVNSIVKGDGKNYFGIAKVTSTTNWFDARQGLTVAQANAIDTKIDDGLVQQGKVLGIYFVSNPVWVAPNSYPWGHTGSSTTCGNNNGVHHVPYKYSVHIDGGANINCALVFQFQ